MGSIPKMYRPIHCVKYIKIIFVPPYNIVESGSDHYSLTHPISHPQCKGDYYMKLQYGTLFYCPTKLNVHIFI